MNIQNDNIFHNKVDFQYETSTRNRHFDSGDQPFPREVRSQKAQHLSGHKPDMRNDMKTPEKDKRN